jgi:hypothetical protein
MADDTNPPAGAKGAKKGGSSDSSGLKIPPELRENFGELIDLIEGSESMNTEERQYWINILPIMTDDQIVNLREILVNERNQLKVIDEKYSKEIEKIGQEQIVKKTGEERRKRRETRSAKEQEASQESDAEAEALLKEIEAS